MKSRLQILKEIDKNLTYQSIRFNNKQISDELIKSTIDQFFPKLFYQYQNKDISFFTKALKDEQCYKKVRNLVSLHINIEIHLQQIQQRQNEKSKIQDSSSHCVQEMNNNNSNNNNKKMTRAALAKRNQLTQQQLRKDQIYVRLTPKSQNCLQYMLCNRKFPRIQCKLSCNQHIEYLINYLSNKWLPGKGQYRIVLYPDVGSYLKNSLPAKERQKILKQPLNNYFMFTDVMVGNCCGIGQNGILNLHYDIVEKKKDGGGVRAVSTNGGDVVVNSIQKGGSQRKVDHGVDRNNHSKKVIHLDEIGDSSKKSSSLLVGGEKEEVDHRNLLNNHNNISIGLKHLIGENPKCGINSLQNRQQGFNTSLHHHLHNNNNNNSNHFLSNQSNLLNPNRSIYHDDQSIFKSIGFFAFGTGNANSIGFKKNDFNLLSINSNSLIDIQPMNLQQEHKGNNRYRGDDVVGGIEQQQQQKNSSLFTSKNNHSKNQQKNIIDGDKQQSCVKETVKLKTQTFESAPIYQRQTHKNVNDFQSPLLSQQHHLNNRPQQKQISNSKSNSKLIIIASQQLKEQENVQSKKHQEKKLLDLRNAISFVEEAEGFNFYGVEQQAQEQVSQKSGMKEIKTVCIKKKTNNM